jgi:membrane protein YqaA with SNARE-associated domain
MTEDTVQNAPVSLEPSWFRRLYLKVEAMSATPHAVAAMLLVSVVDGSVFPIPPFVVLVPMVVATPKRWWRLALWGTLASLVGGVIGYYLGVCFHDFVLHHLGIDFNHRIDRFGVHGSIGELLGQNFWVLSLLCSILPTPFKVVAIGSGLVSVPFAKFFLAAVLGRFARFFVVAGVVRAGGPTARKWLGV